MEALSNGMVGLPMTSTMALNELVVDGKNGFVVPFGEIKATAAGSLLNYSTIWMNYSKCQTKPSVVDRYRKGMASVIG